MTPAAKEQIEAFRAWLQRQGFRILATKGQWEALRWEGPMGDGARIAHTNKKGVVSGFGSTEARADWLAWQTAGFDIELPRETAQVFTLPTRPAAEADQPSSFDPPTTVGAYSLLRYTGGSYVGADIHDKANNWVANIHGTNGRKAKPIETYERNIWLFCNAEKMVQLLDDLTARGVSQADLPRLEHLAREVQEFLKGLPK